MSDEVPGVSLTWLLLLLLAPDKLKPSNLIFNHVTLTNVTVPATASNLEELVATLGSAKVKDDADAGVSSFDIKKGKLPSWRNLPICYFNVFYITFIIFYCRLWPNWNVKLV